MNQMQPRVVVLIDEANGVRVHASRGVVVHVLDLDSDDDELALLAERDGKDFDPYERDLFLNNLTEGLVIG